jgi:hypothetical protein
VQAVRFHELVTLGELKPQQGERLSMFLDLERVGLAESYYGSSVYKQRRREATKLGYASNDGAVAPLEVELSELLAAYVEKVDGEP